MNEANRWRAALGQSVAAAYAQDANVAATALGGSVARGWADRHSDIELLVFWQEPPFDTDRHNAVTRAGGAIDIWWQTPPAQPAYQQLFHTTDGRLGQLWPYEDEEWSEHFYVRGVEIGVSGFLCSTVDQYLVDVVEQCDTTERKHILLAAITSGVPLTGAAQFERWQTKAREYPDELAAIIVAEQLDDDDDWWGCQKLAEREQRYMLYPLFDQMAVRIIRMLLALNHVYLPEPGLKWRERFLPTLPISPVNLSARLERLYQVEPVAAVEELQQIFDETLDLVRRRLPAVETSFPRRWYQHRRVQWDDAPGDEGR